MDFDETLQTEAWKVAQRPIIQILLAICFRIWIQSDGILIWPWSQARGSAALC